MTDVSDEAGGDDLPHVVIKVYYGGQTVTDPYMATVFPGYGSVARKFSGHTVVHVILRSHTELGTLGGIPQFKWRIKGKKNIATNDNGSVTGYNVTAAAVLADYLKEHVGVDPSDIVNHSGGGLSSLIAECTDTSWDETGGGLSRYTFHGVIRDDMEIVEACNLIASHMGGGYSERGTKIVMWTGTIKAPWADGPLGPNDFAGPVETMQPDEDEWVNTLVPHFVAWQSLDEDGFNTLSGQMIPTQEQPTKAIYLTEDGDDILKQDIKFEACPQSPRAVWMARCALDTMRLGAQYTRRFHKRAIVLEVGDVYEIFDPDRLSANTKFRLVKKSAPNPVDFTVELTGVRYEDAIYTGQSVSEDSIGVVSNNRSSILPLVTGLTTFIVASGRVGADGLMTLDVLFSWTAPTNLLIVSSGGTQIEWKRTVDSWPGKSVSASGGASTKVAPGLLDGVTYHARARFYGGPTGGRSDRPVGKWTLPITFTPRLSELGIYKPVGPPIGGADGTNLLSDPYILWPFNSALGSNGIKLGNWVLTNDDGGAPAPIGATQTVTGVGFWSVLVDGVATLTSIRMQISSGEADDSQRFNVLEYIPVRPGQVITLGASIKIETIGRIEVYALFYNANQSFISGGSFLVAEAQILAVNSFSNTWLHTYAPVIVAPIGSTNPSFIRLQFRQVKVGSVTTVQTIHIDGLLLKIANEAHRPYDKDEDIEWTGHTTFIQPAWLGNPLTYADDPDIDVGVEGFWSNGIFGLRAMCTFEAHMYVSTGGGAGTVESNLEFQLVIMDTTHPPWKKSTIYQIGDLVRNKGSLTEPHRIYICNDAGTSASSGRGPSGTGGAIADGTAGWNYDIDLPITPISEVRTRGRYKSNTISSPGFDVHFDVRATAAELGVGSRTLALYARFEPGSDVTHHTASIRAIRMQYVIEEAQVTSARTG